jgi:hypothetical protein
LSHVTQFTYLSHYEGIQFQFPPRGKPSHKEHFLPCGSEQIYLLNGNLFNCCCLRPSWTFSFFLTQCEIVQPYEQFYCLATTVLKRTTCACDLCPHPFNSRPFARRKSLFFISSQFATHFHCMDTWDIVIHPLLPSY